jgi:transcription initiation factor TFIIIB Brf1 subunit/transcription initiation factor TFIIB
VAGGIHKNADYQRNWTPQEDLLLYRYCERKTQAEVAQMLDRTEMSIKLRAQRLRIGWTQGRCTIHSVAKEYNLWPSTVNRLCTQLEIEKHVVGSTANIEDDDYTYLSRVIEARLLRGKLKQRDARQSFAGP